MDGTLTLLVALGAVILIDLTLAGDNAIIIGTIAAGVPATQRVQVMMAGIGVAIVCRILFALVAVQLLAFVGLLLAGGLLLLWVAWKMWREIRHALPSDATGAGALKDVVLRSRGAAILQIGIADVSMSLDNVLGVAGSARHHPAIMAIGLMLSIALMALAAGYIARAVCRYPWLNLLGLAVVVLVSLSMIYEGSHQVLAAI